MRGRFDVWAPNAESMTLVADGVDYPMTRSDAGWWTPQGTPEGREIRYGYRIDGGEQVFPDPRARRQPDGVHELSQTVDDVHPWSDDAWTGRQLAGSVIYELHIGTFTEEGTLDSAIDKLDHLVDLGVDLVEVMPVNAFNGEHGWGYDGVAWYAVHEPYGGPAAYACFVDACHARGLGVIQDVVYNHLGPSGNYLPQFGPYLNFDVANPWGAAVNLDGAGSDEVRRYILDNVRMWFCDFHVDGLRLDAVHAFIDTRAVPLLEEMSIEVEALSAHLRRPLTLIAESDLNDPALITPRAAGGRGLQGQWSDDFHHAVVANLTGDATGYYSDFADMDALAAVFEDGFRHDGSYSSFRGRHHGRPLNPTTASWQLVVCSDNHDQIGNRADGHRLSTRVSRDQLAIAAALTLLGPGTPMIFQGEEWGSRRPWMFFTSHPEPELGQAVSEGRKREFARMNWDLDAVPDPQSPETFIGSKVAWSELEDPDHQGLLGWYRLLISLRRRHPAFTSPEFAGVITHDTCMVAQRSDAVLAVNLDSETVTIPISGELAASWGDVTVEDGLRLGAHSVAVLTQVPPPKPE